MGLTLRQKRGNGAHIEGAEHSVDLIISDIQGFTGEQNVRFDVRGIPHKKTLNVVLGGGYVTIFGEALVRIAGERDPYHRYSSEVAEMEYDAPKPEYKVKPI